MKKGILLSTITAVLVFCFSAGAYSQCPSNMISYWRLQEDGGSTFADDMGNHVAIASASPSQTAGISGKGQLFNGASYLSIASHSDFDWESSSSFTIEAWAKYSNSNPTEVIIGRDDPTSQTHWWLGKNETGKIELYLRASDKSDGNIIATANTNDGNWHHIVAVKDAEAGKIFLYIDGVVQNEGGTAVTLGSLASTADITIGNMVYNNNPMYYYNGSVDEVALYGKALSTDEILSHYNNVKNYQIGYCSGNNAEIFSKPKTTAVLSQPYSYDVDGSGNPLPAYSLVSSPTGMTINASTGVISWNPSSFSQNTPVVVRASNSEGTVEQVYNIFLADAPECRENLIASWDFENLSGTGYQDNIGDYKLSGNVGRTNGRLGHGLAFDGINDSLNLKDTGEPDNKIFFDFDDVPNFSIELWMKSSATPSKVMVMVGREEDQNNTQYWLGVNTNGTVGFYLRDYLEPANTLYLEGGSVLDGAWHHIVATFNATTNKVKLYVDKNLVKEGTQNFGNFGGNDPLNIGCLNTSLDKFWYEGVLDELAFYNTDLSEDAIIKNYNEAMAGIGACVLNYAPLILSEPINSANEDALYSYPIVVSELNSTDTVSISAVSIPSWINFNYIEGDSTATLSGTPSNENVGTYDITIRVTDGKLTVDQSFQIEVVNVNDAPVFTSSPLLSVNEDSEYSYKPTASDVDANDVLTFSAISIPDWMTFNSETSTLIGTPENDHVGVWDIVLSVSDGTVSVDQDFQVTVNNVNDAPVITSTLEQDTIQATNSFMYEFTATDVDEGDELVFSAELIPDWLDFTAGTNSGVVIGTPSNDDEGTHVIILKVNDGHGDVVQTITIVVTPFVGVEEIDNSIINKVYPTPASQIVYFIFAKTKACRVELYDMTGKLHKQKSSEGDRIELPVLDLPNGIYIYKAYQDDRISIGKITKE